MSETKNLGEMLKKHDADKAAVREKQQNEAETFRQLAIEARNRALTWYNDIFTPATESVNKELREGGAGFELTCTEISPGHFKVEVFLTRRAFKSSCYAFYFHNDLLVARCEIRQNTAGRNARIAPQPLVNERSVVSKHQNVPLKSADATWVRAALQEIFEENLTSM